MKQPLLVFLPFFMALPLCAQEVERPQTTFKADSIQLDSNGIRMFGEEVEMTLSPDVKVKFEPKSKPSKQEKVFYSGVNFFGSWGLNNPYSSWGDGQIGYVNRTTYEFYYVQERWKESPIWGHLGLAWDFIGVDFNPNAYLSTTFLDGVPNGLAVMEAPSTSEMEIFWRRSQFLINYLTLNSNFVFNASRSGRKGLSLSVGNSLSLRMGKPTMYRDYYITGLGRVNDRVSSNFYTMRWAYSVQARIGYNNFFIEARKSATPVFTPEAQMPVAFLGNIGFGYSVKW
ncbi:MAG: hypothetical protein EBZ21_04420 [Flavobacteriia bacterium]|nr:hypothetical protein [Flavobacteriia bacterium]